MMADGEGPRNLDKFSDKGFAWFKLTFGVIYMAFGTFCLIVFFRARTVFEIRARSVYLVTTLGLLLLMYQGLNVDLHAIVLFGAPANFFQNNLVVFFVTFSIASCYICRVIRLVVGFTPRLRRSLPWLMSEKLLIISSLSIGVLSLSIPLYYHFTITGDMAEVRFAEEQGDNVWTCTLVLQVLQLALFPAVWIIDDLFHISRELLVIIVIGIIQSVFVKLAMEKLLGDKVQEWINPPNLQFAATAILFGLSVIDPVRRLHFSPMAKSSAAMARAISSRRRRSSARSRSVTPTGIWSRDYEESRGLSGLYYHQMWNYEKIAQNEAMAEAFRVFANRALCQESLWFLEEVARYQKEDYTIAAPFGGGQLAAFEAITKRFIAEGAPDEVNISFKDKKAILSLYNRSNDTFDSTSEENALSSAFDQAYAEVRFMIESNILHKFTETEEFHKAADTPPPNRKTRRFCLPC